MTDREQIEYPQEAIPIHNWVESFWFRALLIFVFALGVFFRLSRLGYKIYSHDEAYTSLRAAGYLGEEVVSSIQDGKDKKVDEIQQFLKPNKEKNILHTLSSLILSEPHVSPLYFLLAHYWMRLVGYTPAAMRGLATIFGLLSIPGVYWFSKELFHSRRITLLSTTLLAISPYHILYSQDARPYSLWTLATLLSNAALIRAMRNDKAIDWGIYSLTLILGMYSHQLFALVVITHGFYFIVIYIMLSKKRYAGFLSACVFALLIYAPWMYQMITRWQVVTSRMDWVNIQIPWYRYIQRWILIFSSPFIDLEFNSGNIIPYLLRALILGIVAWGLVFLLIRTQKRVWMFLFLLYIVTTGPIIIPDLIGGGIRSIGGRYFVPANIATILVIAFFLSKKLDKPTQMYHRRWSLAFSLLVGVSIVSNINSMFAETWWNKELSRVRPEFVHTISQPGQALLVVSDRHPTNLGDVLLLSIEVTPNVLFRLYKNPTDIEYPSNYKNSYWFPNNPDEVQRISLEKGFHVREIIKDTLWRFEDKSNYQRTQVYQSFPRIR